MWRHWKIALALVVIFIAGTGAGVAIGRVMAAKRQQTWLRPETWETLVMKRMDERLHLSEEQKTALGPILEKTAERLQAQRRRAFVEQLQTVRGFYEEAESHLTPEQKEQFANSRQRLRDRMQQENPPFPPRGPVPGSRPGPGGGVRPVPPAPAH